MCFRTAPRVRCCPGVKFLTSQRLNRLSEARRWRVLVPPVLLWLEFRRRAAALAGFPKQNKTLVTVIGNTMGRKSFTRSTFVGHVFAFFAANPRGGVHKVPEWFLHDLGVILKTGH